MIHPDRTQALSFRVTPDELTTLKQAAAEADQSVSDFIRSRLFDYAAVPQVKRLPGEAVPLVHDGKHRDADKCIVCQPPAPVREGIDA